MHKLLCGRLRVEHLTIPIANLPEELAGTTLVQLSDFHYDGKCLSDELLMQAIAASNQARPDLVLLTGDYVTTVPEPIFDLIPHLQRLQSRYGIYAILGNHDVYYHRVRRVIMQAMAQARIQVLWNNVVYPLGRELALVGLADVRSTEFLPQPVMEAIAPDIPRIVLSHNPDTADVLRQWRVDLQLSGHTHGGQVHIPGYGPLPKLLKALHRRIHWRYHRFIPYVNKSRHVVRNWDWASGLHPVGNNWLYVNRGLGTYFPGRLFCPPEVTVIRLISA
jgi:uncharacterized protein